MAIVKGPALSIEASGNMGAICYSRWRGLQIARDTWTGTYVWSSRREFVRDIIIMVSRYWGEDLSPEEREAWEDVARSERWKSRLGDDLTPTGYMLFCKINLLRLNIHPTYLPLKLPPRLPNPVYVGVWEVRMHATKDEVVVVLSKSFPWVVLDCDGFQVYRAGPYDSGGRRALEGEYRFRYNERGLWYGDSFVIDGKWYWYKARWFFDEGFVGNWFEGQAHVVFH